MKWEDVERNVKAFQADGVREILLRAWPDDHYTLDAVVDGRVVGILGREGDRFDFWDSPPKQEGKWVPVKLVDGKWCGLEPPLKDYEGDDADKA